MKIDRCWSEYPIGTKAFSVGGGHWTRTRLGWKWCTGATFPTPGGDAFRVELPDGLLPLTLWPQIGARSPIPQPLTEADLHLGMRVKITNRNLDCFCDWEDVVCVIVGLQKKQSDSEVSIELEEEGLAGIYDGWKLEDIGRAD